jgi:hypothetical protein
VTFRRFLEKGGETLLSELSHFVPCVLCEWWRAGKFPVLALYAQPLAYTHTHCN